MNHGHSEPSVVTAGEISRNFGQWQDRALSGPVIVTHHGRPRVVLISADHYSTWRDEPVGAPDQEQTSFEISRSAILDHMAEAFVALDAQLNVVAVNHVLEALAGLSATQIVGRSWEPLFPVAARSMVGEQVRRTLRTGEALDFEIQGDGPGQRRYAIRAFPHPEGVALLIRNRTAEREMQHQLREAAALSAALALSSEVSTLRLNARGIIETVDARFTDMVGFSAEELRACALPDLVRPRDRAELRSALNAVLQGGAPIRLTTSLVLRDGGEAPVELALASVMQDLAPDGLVAVITTEHRHGVRVGDWRSALPERV